MYTLVGKTNCTWCDRAELVMNDCGIDYQKLDMAEHPWIKTLFIDLNLNTVPQVFDHNGNLIGGFEELVQHVNNIDMYQ